MRLGRRSIEADGHSRQPCLFQNGKTILRDGGGAARRQCDRQASTSGVPHKLREIGTPHRVAAGEDQERRSRTKSAYLVDQAKPLFGCQLAWIAAMNRVRPAVHACERARAGHLPDDEEWTLIEVGRGHVSGRHAVQHDVRRPIAPMTGVIRLLSHLRVVRTFRSAVSGEPRGSHYMVVKSPPKPLRHGDCFQRVAVDDDEAVTFGANQVLLTPSAHGANRSFDRRSDHVRNLLP